MSQVDMPSMVVFSCLFWNAIPHLQALNYGWSVYVNGEVLFNHKDVWNPTLTW